MNQDVYDWVLLIGRWIHITTAVTWIGTSIFFMWLDRSIDKNGDLWLVHGGGFYHVKKSLMGTTQVPEELHWFKWESYWTWMSGIFLILLVFYTGNGTALLDSSVSKISFLQGILVSLLALVISWFFYDFIWERKFTKTNPALGHALTLAWLGGMAYFLCHTLSGRAAYLHIGAMLGTWMTANVFLRIIPRQLKMVEAAKRGEAVNHEWAKNAKNRSTHNTYFTLPVIFLMMSNHFPGTYGNRLNWLILLLMCAGGAATREFFIARVKNPKRSRIAAAVGATLILSAFSIAKEPSSPEGTTTSSENLYSNPISTPAPGDSATVETAAAHQQTGPQSGLPVDPHAGQLRGVVKFEGTLPEKTKLSLPPGCTQKRGDVFSNEVLVKNGIVQDVVVRITKGLEGKTFTPAPSESVKLDQHDCMYSPRTIAVRSGQPVEFINSDQVFHNVLSITQKNEQFNVGMPQKDQHMTKVFNTPEIMQTKCSVHPWMNSNIVVMEHPFFATTPESGEFSIANVPPGTYTVEAWHEVFGVQSQQIVVKENETLNLVFTYRK